MSAACTARRYGHPCANVGEHGEHANEDGDVTWKSYETDDPDETTSKLAAALIDLQRVEGPAWNAEEVELLGLAIELSRDAIDEAACECGRQGRRSGCGCSCTCHRDD